MPPPPRVPRPVAEMAAALRTHVTLLARYIEAVEMGDDAYLGEIAGKLRLLVIATSGNKPLLRRLADLTGDELQFTLDGPPVAYSIMGETSPAAGETVSLETFLGMGGAYIRSVTSGELVELTNSEFVATWAQQYGASHEDWSLSEAFHLTRHSIASKLLGFDAHAAMLLSIARVVLKLADEYLSGLTDEKLTAAEAELRQRQGRQAT